MPVLVTKIPFFGRRDARRTAPPAPVVGPILTSATLDLDVPAVVLGFDRAIDMTAFVPFEIVVLDSITGQEWGATIDSTMLDPQTVRITLIVNGEYGGPGVKLTATDGAGIVATDDSEPWAGVANLSLPYSA